MFPTPSAILLFSDVPSCPLTPYLPIEIHSYLSRYVV
jgi:hypothetical protein